jgi:hypothetical protein
MDNTWLHIAVILMFTLVPMVQVVSADTTSKTSLSDWLFERLARYNTDSTGGGLFPSSNTGWSGSGMNGQFPYVPSTIRTRTIATPHPTPVPPDPSAAPVYISGLDVTGEYVKLTNQDSQGIPMTGWKISSSKGKNIRFIDWTNPDGSIFSFTLRPYSTVTIYSGRSGTITPTRLYWPYEMWDDAGDTAYLYDPEGNLVSSLTR